MITPDKHLDLNHCVIRAGAELLAYLKSHRVASFDQLRARLVKKLGAEGEIVFHPTLNFLFLLGRLDYHAQSDRFEYLGPQNSANQPIVEVAQ